MIWIVRHRHKVLEDIPFVHNQLLANLPARFPFSYRAQVTFEGVRYEVVLDWVSKGQGHVLMFRCPLSGKMVERLYPSCGRLVSRHVLGLHYASQVRGRIDVLEAKSDRLRRSLCDPLYLLPLEDGVPIPCKPPQMRWQRYWRKAEKLEHLQRQMGL